MRSRECGSLDIEQLLTATLRMVHLTSRGAFGAH